MSTLCQVMDESFVPNFEGIDPPLLDPLMVEHFKNQAKPAPAKKTVGNHAALLQQSPSTSASSSIVGIPRTAAGKEPKPAGLPANLNLEGLSIDDLLNIVTKLCETDPSLTEQILGAFNLNSIETDTRDSSPEPAKKQVPESQKQQVPGANIPTAMNHSQLTPTTDSETPFPDTNTILKTLNQSLFLQELTNSLLPSSISVLNSGQLHSSQVLNGNGFDNTPNSSVSMSPDTFESMKSNLFVMDKQGSNFVPVSQRDNMKRPKYSRKNFSPEQIEGLETAFQKHRFVRKELRRELAKKLSLSERSISYWFQNKRARSKPPITMSSEAARKAAREEQQQRLQQRLQQIEHSPPSP